MPASHRSKRAAVGRRSQRAVGEFLDQEPAPRSAALPHRQPVSLIWRREESFCPPPQPLYCMSCDLQRIVPTFVPSFDPLLTIAPSHLTSSAAPHSCGAPLYFSSTAKTQRWRIPAFLPKSGRINELLPCSYAPPPPRCFVLRVFLHTSCVHVQCVFKAECPPSPLRLPRRPLSLHLSSPRSSAGAVTPGQAWADV